MNETTTPNSSPNVGCPKGCRGRGRKALFGAFAVGVVAVQTVGAVQALGPGPVRRGLCGAMDPARDRRLDRRGPRRDAGAAGEALCHREGGGEGSRPSSRRARRGAPAGRGDPDRQGDRPGGPGGAPGPADAASDHGFRAADGRRGRRGGGSHPRAAGKGRRSPRQLPGAVRALILRPSRPRPECPMM